MNTVHGPRGLSNPDMPNWAPLEIAITPGQLHKFMAMGKVHQGEITIYLYKHRDTRRYLNLDSSGRQAYRFTTSGYEPISMVEAIHHAFT